MNTKSIYYYCNRNYPFPDGNGSIGRLLLAKELLKIDGVPLVMRDENHAYYLRGLREIKANADYLVAPLLNEQDY